MDYKSRVFNAIKRHTERQQKVNAGPKRKNNKPEKIVEFQVTQWLKKNDFAYNVVESKAVFNRSANRFIKGQTDQGFSDIVGLDKRGNFIAIELKAPGRKSTLRPRQREFLIERINRGGFCVCVESDKELESVYNTWLSNKSAEYLLGLLPKEKTPKSEDDEDVLFKDL